MCEEDQIHFTCDEDQIHFMCEPEKQEQQKPHRGNPNQTKNERKTKNEKSKVLGLFGCLRLSHVYLVVIGFWSTHEMDLIFFTREWSGTNF